MGREDRTPLETEEHQQGPSGVVIDTDDLDDPPEFDDQADDDSSVFDGWAEDHGDREDDDGDDSGDSARRGHVTYRGKKFSPSFRDALKELEILLPDVPVHITQGGFNGTNVAASAGTHAGDAVDLSVRGLTEAQVAAIISTARRVGIAAWFRTTDTPKWGTRAQGFKSYHIHGVPNKWGSASSGASKQADSYRTGKDGLKRQLADRGPGHVSAYRKQTWATYRASSNASSDSVQVDDANLPPLIPEDGDFGPVTIKRVQRQVRVIQDGDFGPVTTSAFRTWLRFDPGTRIDSRVVKTLQGRVGVRRDGDWGPVTTKGLQRFLNRNRTH